MSEKLMESNMVEFHKYGDSTILITNGEHKGYLIDLGTLEEVNEKAKRADGGKDFHEENLIGEIDTENLGDAEKQIAELYKNASTQGREALEDIVTGEKKELLQNLKEVEE